MAGALERYVRAGGLLFVEARPGWQDERGHAAAILPAFGWDRLFGVHESEVLPVKQVSVRWGDRVFGGTSFAEHFDAVDPAARAIATFDDGAPAAYERTVGDGRTIILGTFAGEANAVDPVPMNPLGDRLVEWAKLDRPALRASRFVELRRMTAPAGELVLFLNHGQQPAQLDYAAALRQAPRSIREIAVGLPPAPARSGAGSAFALTAEIPGERVRVYRIDY
jgi:beta-galactosidase